MTNDPHPMHPQLWKWFDDGRAVAALVGGGPYFLPGYTYNTTHDRLLVLRQLAMWSLDRGRPQVVNETILAALDLVGGDKDAWAVYDIVWCYIIIRDEGSDFPSVDVDKLGEFLSTADAFPSADDGRVRHLRESVRKAI